MFKRYQMSSLAQKLLPLKLINRTDLEAEFQATRKSPFYNVGTVSMAPPTVHSSSAQKKLRR
jgi:hypothetical protein